MPTMMHLNLHLVLKAITCPVEATHCNIKLSLTNSCCLKGRRLLMAANNDHCHKDIVTNTLKLRLLGVTIETTYPLQGIEIHFDFYY